MISSNKRLLYCRIVLTIVLSAALSGCAYYAGITNVSGKPVVDVLATIKNGEARLPCSNKFCGKALDDSRPTITSLFNNKSWELLAIEIAKVGYSCDQMYYFLGLAVEGLGYESTAETYFQLGLNEKNTCYLPEVVHENKAKIRAYINIGGAEGVKREAARKQVEKRKQAEIEAKERAVREREQAELAAKVRAAREKLLTSGTPEELYLAGVKSETESDYDRASTLYNQVLSRFSKAPVALKAADRLLAIKDKLDMQKRDSDSQAKAQRDTEKRRAEESDENLKRLIDNTERALSNNEAARQQEWQMNQQKDQNRRLCEAQKQTCLASCRPNDSSCKSGCRRISCW